MARTLSVQGLVTNGVSVGGLATLSFNPRYRDIPASPSDGAVGSEDVDRSGLMCEVSLSCGDVIKAAAILNATPASTTFSTKEAGLATFHEYTIDGSADGQIIWTGMTLAIPKTPGATLTVNGVIRFLAGTKLLADILALTATQAAPTLTYPSRLYRAHNFSFDPTGAAPAITLSHLDQVQLSLAAAEVFAEYGDDDVAMSDVDRGGWAPLQVTITHGDVTAKDPSHVNAELLAAERGVLTMDVMGRAGGTEQVLTINNLLWQGAPENERSGYTELQLAGSSGWREGEVNYGLETATGPPAYTALWGFGDKE